MQNKLVIRFLVILLLITNASASVVPLIDDAFTALNEAGSVGASLQVKNIGPDYWTLSFGVQESGVVLILPMLAADRLGYFEEPNNLTWREVDDGFNHGLKLLKSPYFRYLEALLKIAESHGVVVKSYQRGLFDEAGAVFGYLEYKVFYLEQLTALEQAAFTRSIFKDVFGIELGDNISLEINLSKKDK